MIKCINKDATKSYRNYLTDVSMAMTQLFYHATKINGPFVDKVLGRNSYLNTRRFNEAGLARFENLSSPYHYQHFPGGFTRHLFFILFYPSF